MRSTGLLLGLGGVAGLLLLTGGGKKAPPPSTTKLGSLSPAARSALIGSVGVTPPPVAPTSLADLNYFFDGKQYVKDDPFAQYDWRKMSPDELAHSDPSLYSKILDAYKTTGGFTCPLIYTGEDFAADASKYVSEDVFSHYQSTPWRFGAKWFQAPTPFYVIEDKNFNPNSDDWVGDGFHEGDSPKSLIDGIAHFGQGTYNDLLFSGLIVEFAYPTWLISGVGENPLNAPPPFIEALIIGSIAAIASCCAAGVALSVGGAVAGAAAAGGGAAAGGATVGGGAGGSFVAAATTSGVITPGVTAAAGGGVVGTLTTVGQVAGYVGAGITLICETIVKGAGSDCGPTTAAVVNTGQAVAQGAVNTGTAISSGDVGKSIGVGAGTVNGVVQNVAPNSKAAAGAQAANSYIQSATTSIQNGTSPLQAGINTATSVVLSAAQTGGLLPKNPAVPGASTPDSISAYASLVALALPQQITNFVSMLQTYADNVKERKSGRFYAPMVPPDALAAYVQRRRLGASVSESLTIARNVAPLHWRWAMVGNFMSTTVLHDRLDKLIALHQKNEQIAQSQDLDPSVKLLAGCAVPGYTPPDDHHTIAGTLKFPGVAALARMGSSGSGGGLVVAAAAGAGLLYVLAKRKKR